MIEFSGIRASIGYGMNCNGLQGDMPLNLQQRRDKIDSCNLWLFISLWAPLRKVLLKWEKYLFIQTRMSGGISMDSFSYKKTRSCNGSVKKRQLVDILNWDMEDDRFVKNMIAFCCKCNENNLSIYLSNSWISGMIIRLKKELSEFYLNILTWLY